MWNLCRYQALQETDVLKTFQEMLSQSNEVFYWYVNICYTIALLLIRKNWAIVWHTHLNSFKSLMWMGRSVISVLSLKNSHFVTKKSCKLLSLCMCVRKMDVHIVKLWQQWLSTADSCWEHPHITPMPHVQIPDVWCHFWNISQTAVGSGHGPVLKQWQKALKSSCKCFPMLFSSPKDYCVMICLLSLFFSHSSIEVSHIRLFISPPFFL